jgi:hypothetical protein
LKVKRKDEDPAMVLGIQFTKMSFGQAGLKIGRCPRTSVPASKPKYGRVDAEKAVGYAPQGSQNVLIKRPLGGSRASRPDRSEFPLSFAAP